MDTQKFEEKLIEMTKPDEGQLRHRQMLADAITNAKDGSVVSWWWLIIPLYIVFMLMMKSIYMTDTTLISNMNDFKETQKFTALTLFLIVPLALILINFIMIRKVYILSGSPKSLSLIRSVWINAFMILFSVLILLFYSL